MLIKKERFSPDYCYVVVFLQMHKFAFDDECLLLYCNFIFFAVLQMQGYRLQVCGFCDIFMTDQQIQEKLIF